MRATSLTRGLLALALASSVTACSFGGDDDDEGSTTQATAVEGKGGNGKTVKIAFSAPAADHGWMAAVTKFAESQAGQYDDVEFISTEGAADSANQVAQVESLLARDPDVLVILPNEGGALTQVAQQA